MDELNLLKTKIQNEIARSDEDGNDVDIPYLIDSVLDILIMSYVFGCESANEDLETSIKPQAEEMQSSIYKVIEGKTFEDRVREYGESKDIEKIMRVAETESHRVYNDSQFATAKQSGLKVKKTWSTMLDERVRDTHEFLEGVTLDLDERFYTLDGDSALQPGGFESASGNCNCRCELILSKEQEKGKA